VGSGRGSKNASGRSTWSIRNVIALTATAMKTAATSRRPMNVTYEADIADAARYRPGRR
jgi:hypothetical protein